MRIACLQFAPQVADVDNNLNRADSVLARANPDDLEGLDLLVLPELAFTGYKFDSLQHISPYLEHAGSGISSLWARTTALRLNTAVVVGYPEMVDVSQRWPTSPEYYNSSIVIDRDGQTIANYRKSFLYAIDETWALEGKDGFFQGDLPGLGRTAMGICMDLNPYKFQAPWHAFEFGFHIIEVQANLVIINMAWLTRDDVRAFSRTPLEPDMETLTYWVQRLEPVIRTEGEHEIIVVFCNRTGFEDDAVYAGTSAVLGIVHGEVNVYGILGRGVKDLLVVDTDDTPFAKLVQQSGRDAETTPVVDRHHKLENSQRERPLRTATLQEPTSVVEKGQRKLDITPDAITKPKKSKPVPASIQIPGNSHPRQRSSTQSTPIESPGVATPTCPSPTPLSERPMISLRESMSIKEQVKTAPARHGLTEENLRAWAGQSPNDQSAPRTACSDHLTEKYFWLPTQTALKSPMEIRFPQHYPPPSPTAVTPTPSSLVRIPREERRSNKSPLSPKKQPCPKSGKSGGFRQSARLGRHLERPSAMLDDANQTDDSALPRPYLPKSRNLSRTGRPPGRQASEFEQPDLSATIDRLGDLVRRPGSAMDSCPSDFDQPRQGRSHYSKARTASRTGACVGTPQLEGRAGNVSQAEYPLTASPSIFHEETAHPHSDMVAKAEAPASRSTFDQRSIRPCPRAGAQSRNRSLSGAGGRHPQSRSGSSSRVNSEAVPYIEADDTRTMVWSELSKIVVEMLDRPQSRGPSRGRQPAAKSATTAAGVSLNRTARSESRGHRAGTSTSQRFASQDRGGAASPSNIRTTQTSNGVNGSSVLYNSDDEIVAEIIFRSQRCPAHSQLNSQGQSTPSQASNPRSPPSLPRGRSSQEKNSNSRLGQRKNDTPQTTHKTQNQGRSKWLPKPPHERHIAPAALNISGRTESSDSRPPVDDSSAHALTMTKGSPATPPSRSFEPTTPKAMKLDPDFGAILTSTSDPASAGEFTPMDALTNKILGIGIARPRSAVW